MDQSEEAKPAPWTRRHLLGLEELSAGEIRTLLDAAEDYVALSMRKEILIFPLCRSSCASSICACSSVSA